MYAEGYLPPVPPPPDEILRVHLASLLQTLAPPGEEVKVHLECVNQLKEMVKELGPGWQISPFGSAANGFLMRGGDLDVTCYHAAVPEQDSHLAIDELKNRLLPLFNQQLEFDIKQTIWGARVPILKLKYRSRIDVDLSCHNLQALQNSHYLKAYSDLCPTIRGLALCVKFWSKHEGVNGAPEGFLSSYSMTLMVLYFLQVDPQLAMPCLPTQYFSSHGASPEVSRITWTCPMPLPAVLRKFFIFYGSDGGGFQWGSEVVSVRLGWRCQASNEHFGSLPGRTTNRLHVEDPFLSRNLNCVLSVENEHITKMKFQEAAGKFLSSQVPAAFLIGAEEAEIRTLRTLRGVPPPPAPGYQNPLSQQAYQPPWPVNASISHPDHSSPPSTMLNGHISMQPESMASLTASSMGTLPVQKQQHKANKSGVKNISQAPALTSTNVQIMKKGVHTLKANGSAAPISDCESTQSGGATSATASTTPAGRSRSASSEHKPAYLVESVKTPGEVKSKPTKKFGRNKIPQSIDENTIQAVPSVGSEAPAPEPGDIPVPKLFLS